MKQSTIYTCEKCGLEIKDDFLAMLDHESSHVKPKVFQGPVADTYYPGQTYPCEVIIEMNNGAKVQYSHPIEIESPLEKESPQQED